LPPASEVELYEHYTDGPPELDRVQLDPEAEIVWSGVAHGKDSVREAFERFRAELINEGRQSELTRELERCRRASGSIDAAFSSGNGCEHRRHLDRLAELSAPER